MSLIENAAEMIADRAETVTLTRTTRAAPADQTPWIPGAATTTTYTFGAFVKGVSAKHVDGTTVLATDRLVIAPPQATLDGVVVDLEPVMTDILQIGGRDAVIKKIEAKKDGGAVAKYNIFVAS